MTSEDLPRRKKIRLEGYDYSANGLYFVTICVTEKYQVLWENVGANSVRPLTANEILHPKLSVTGKLVKRKLTEISGHYPDVFVEMSCIMPDHVHLLVEVDPQYGIHKAVKALKGYTSKVLRDEFPTLRTRMPALWTNSYFVSTVGGAPLEAVKQYIENQKTSQRQKDKMG